MNKEKKLLLTLTVVLLVLVLGGQFILQKQPDLTSTLFGGKRTFNPEVTTVPIASQPLAKEIEVTIDFNNGNTMSDKVVAKTVYEALQTTAENKKLELEVKKEKYGVMITKIGQSPNTSQYAWLYLVNGKPGQIGADRFLVNPGDKVEWKYTKL